MGDRKVSIFPHCAKKILSEVQLNHEVDVNFVGNEETSKSEKAQKIVDGS